MYIKYVSTIAHVSILCFCWHNGYRVGPASVKAVRRGEIDVKYDCAFVLAEVNADVVFYRQDNRGRRKEIKRLIDE